MLRLNIVSIRVTKRKYYIYTNSNNYNRGKIIPRTNSGLPKNAWEAVND